MIGLMLDKHHLDFNLSLDLNQINLTMSQRRPDIGYLPTEPEVVEAALDLVELQPDDHFYDLGCGDGRLIIRAVERFGCWGVGVDIDPQRILEAQENAKQAGVSERIQFQVQDLYTCDFQAARVVFLYLLPHLNLKLRSQLWQQLKPGSHVISLDFDMGDWKPLQVKQLDSPSESTLYHWMID